MNRFKLSLVVVVAAVAMISACSEDDGTTPVQPKASDAGYAVTTPDGQERTPFQRSLMTQTTQRTSDGLAAPAVSYSYESNGSASLVALQQSGINPGQSLTIRATTVVRYDAPNEAGQSVWPAPVIEGSTPPADGFVLEGDYTQEVKDAVSNVDPNFWSTHTFGNEPRVLTWTETITYTFPQSPATASQQTGPVEGTSDDEIVTGMGIPGPGLDYTLEASLDIPTDLGDVNIGSVRAGFAMDWFFGMRLPMDVSVSGPNSVMEGSSFTPTTVATGLNWSAADFTNAGIAPESGNEFGMRFEFFLGAVVKVAGQTVIDVGPPKIDEDASKSFTTPLGAGQVFNLPTLDVPALANFSGPLTTYFQVGFTATPQAGSDKFTADWHAAAEGSGNGGVMYNTSGASKNLGPVLAVDGPGSADLTLNNFEYVFNQYRIALGMYAEIGADPPFPLPSGSLRFDIPITSFNLSSISPDLTMGVHDGSTPTNVMGSVNVVNVAPTAVIDPTSTMMINGVPTLLAETGVPKMVKGTSVDPGRDDLVATWDFGDGTPTPDISTNYPLAAAAGPNQITDMQSHTFDVACVNDVTFKVTDDDGASNEDHAKVVITPPAGSNAPRYAGYWQHQLRGNGRTDFGDADLGCMLEIVEHMSTVFSEARNASTMDDAFDVIFLAGNHGSELEKLDRELLVMWLNFANGVYGYAENVDVDGDGAGDGMFSHIMATAEAVRLNPGATPSEIRGQTEIVHNIRSATDGLTSLSRPAGRSW